MPIFILVLSQSPFLNIEKSLMSFLIIHLLVYPASNGYNSYEDKDTTSIGGLENPPLPTKRLFYLTAVMDLLAVGLSILFINNLFAICITIYIIASRAYSNRTIRLKKYPLIGFLTVVFFQGAFTYYMCFAGITNDAILFNKDNILIMIACSLQIAGIYPLTQIYQHKEDLADGVTTLSYKLGYKGTFVFTASMFAIATLLYFLYFSGIHRINEFYVLQIFMLPVIIFFIYWFIKVVRNKKEASFRNTMLMNVIAAGSLNVCYIILSLLK